MPLLLLLALAASPERTTVAVIGFRAVEVSAEKVEAFADVFADVLSASSPALKVSSASAVASVLGLERQRKLLGCSSDNQCTTEIINALGPKVIITGAVVKTGSRFLVSVRATSASDGQTLYSDQKLADSEDDVVAWLQQIAPVVGEHLSGSPGVSTSAGSSRVLPIASSAVGVAGIAMAAAFFVMTSSEHQAFLAAKTLSEAHGHASSGNLDQALAWTGVGLIGAAAVGWAVWLLLPASAPQVAVMPGPGGGSLFVGGSF